MATDGERYLSPYLTLSPLAVLSRGASEWRNFFPFTDPGGMWTFSGRVALFAGLARLKLPLGSTILMPSYFQGTEVDTVVAAGFDVRFYAIDEQFRVDLTDVESKLNEKVSALYIIHYFGLSQDLDPITDFCVAKGIALIEDCALALLSRYGDSWLGSRGDLALFSVYKSIPLPHGGFLVTKRSGAPTNLRPPPLTSTGAQTVDLCAQHQRGAVPRRWMNQIWNRTTAIRQRMAAKTIVSGSITLDPRSLELGASSIVPKLMRLCSPLEIIKQRRENFAALHSNLSHLCPLKLEKLPLGACPLFYPIIVEDKLKVRAALLTRGIGTVNLWSQPHPLCPPSVTQQTAAWRGSILELPIHQQIDEEDILRIVVAVLSLRRKSSFVSQLVPTVALSGSGEGARAKVAATG